MQNKQIAEDVLISVFGGHNVLADIYIGYNRQPKRPCIIWLHGGGFVAGDKRQFSGLAAYLSLSLNVVCICVNYRTATTEKFPAPIIDCLGVCNWAYENKGMLAIENIYLAGGSPGANIAAMSIVNGRNFLEEAEVNSKLSIPVNGILLNPILDMNNFYQINPAERENVDIYLGGNNFETRKASSPISYPSDGKSFLILQGDEDDIVGFEGVNQLKHVFTEFGSSVSIKKYENEQHGWFNQSEKIVTVAHDIEEYLNITEGKRLNGIRKAVSTV